MKTGLLVNVEHDRAVTPEEIRELVAGLVTGEGLTAEVVLHFVLPSLEDTRAAQRELAAREAADTQT